VALVTLFNEFRSFARVYLIYGDHLRSNGDDEFSEENTNNDFVRT
jgi:hypothetical protein